MTGLDIRPSRTSRHRAFDWIDARSLASIRVPITGTSVPGTTLRVTTRYGLAALLDGASGQAADRAADLEPTAAIGTDAAPRAS